MGKRGPPPEPTALKELKGNPGGRRLPANEPKPAAAPEAWAPPKELHGEARAEWLRVAGPLQACGILTVVDRATLAAYCISWGLVSEAVRHLKTEGRMLKTPNGHKVVNPWLTVLRQERELMKAYAIEFGLTGAARARMGAAMATPNAPPSGDAPKRPAVGGKFAHLIGSEKPN